jgi:acylphosphatase
VQGVGYRVSFERQARALHLAGWVRNRIDGSVEAVVRGDPEAVEKIIAWSRRGPPGSQVHEVAATEVDDASVIADRFEVLATK